MNANDSLSFDDIATNSSEPNQLMTNILNQHPNMHHNWGDAEHYAHIIRIVNNDFAMWNWKWDMINSAWRLTFQTSVPILTNTTKYFLLIDWAAASFVRLCVCIEFQNAYTKQFDIGYASRFVYVLRRVCVFVFFPLILFLFDRFKNRMNVMLLSSSSS